MASRRRNRQLQRQRKAPPPPPLPKSTRCSDTNKRGYASKLDALSALGSTSRSKRPESRAYQCGFCSRWHLTSQPKRLQP